MSGNTVFRRMVSARLSVKICSALLTRRILLWSVLAMFCLSSIVLLIGVPSESYATSDGNGTSDDQSKLEDQTKKQEVVKDIPKLGKLLYIIIALIALGFIASLLLLSGLRRKLNELHKTLGTINRNRSPNNQNIEVKLRNIDRTISEISNDIKSISASEERYSKMENNQTGGVGHTGDQQMEGRKRNSAGQDAGIWKKKPKSGEQSDTNIWGTDTAQPPSSPIDQLQEEYNAAVDDPAREKGFMENYNPIRIGVTSPGARRRDQNIKPIFKKADNGDYYAIPIEGEGYIVVPRLFLTLQETIYGPGAMGEVFECPGYEQGKAYDRVKITKPARFADDPAKEQWQLNERGILDLSN